jgi:hypothetical protein
MGNHKVTQNAHNKYPDIKNQIVLKKIQRGN